ncbi:MAG: hypothetical protein ACREEO_14370 [Phenylobacterium sp.]
MKRQRAGPHTDRVLIVCDVCGNSYNERTFDPAGACEHIRQELARPQRALEEDE